MAGRSRSGMKLGGLLTLMHSISLLSRLNTSTSPRPGMRLMAGACDARTPTRYGIGAARYVIIPGGSIGTYTCCHDRMPWASIDKAPRAQPVRRAGLREVRTTRRSHSRADRRRRALDTPTHRSNGNSCDDVVDRASISLCACSNAVGTSSLNVSTGMLYGLLPNSNALMVMTLGLLAISSWAAAYLAHKARWLWYTPCRKVCCGSGRGCSSGRVTKAISCVPMASTVLRMAA
mmetsp:Transcript_195/g.507  ORF Transcript_195/g.507 Transcript_195/m.507 type:complete len:233 (-) Transcript_195:266-964(-)